MIKFTSSNIDKLIYTIPAVFLTRGIHSLFLYVANGEPHNLLSPLLDGLVGAAILLTVSKNLLGRAIRM